jgi:hypothetical protein
MKKVCQATVNNLEGNSLEGAGINAPFSLGSSGLPSLYLRGCIMSKQDMWTALRAHCDQRDERNSRKETRIKRRDEQGSSEQMMQGIFTNRGQR